MSKISLKCDKEGFLIGEIIGKNECEKARQSVAVPKQGMPSVQSVAVPKQGKKTDVDQSNRKPLQKAVTPNTELLRDEKGRYLPKAQQTNQNNSQSENADQKTQEASKNNRLIDAIKSGLNSAAHADTQGIDPNIDAIKEASTPFVMAGGAIKTASSLFSRKNKQPVAIPQITQLAKAQSTQNSTQNRDWRSFFKRFDWFAKNQSMFNKTAEKTLKEIEKKPIANGANSAGGAVSVGGNGLKSIFKKLPIVGALLGGLFASSSISDTENDDTLSRKEKDQANGKTIGGVGGMLAGAAAGAALGSAIPVIGTIIGGIAGAFFGGSAGELIGETVGGWVSDLRGSDIAGTILSGWEVVSTSASSSFEALSSSASESWEKMTVKFTPIIDSLSSFFDSISTGFSSALDSLNGWVKTLTGIDIGAKLKSGYGSVKNYVKDSPVAKTAGYVADKATTAYEKTKDFFTGDSKARKQALEAEMTKSGITNTNERAMIMAQADHESGGFLHNEESFKYRTPEQLMKVSKTARDKGADAVQAALNGGAESTAELMYGGRMGNTEKGDGYKYRGRGAFQLTGKDNYKQASNDLGIDLVNNPDLAMDKDISAKLAVWYAKKEKLAQAAQAGNVEAVTQIINGGQNGIDDRKALFAKYGGVESPNEDRGVSNMVYADDGTGNYILKKQDETTEKTSLTANTEAVNDSSNTSTYSAMNESRFENRTKNLMGAIPVNESEGLVSPSNSASGAKTEKEDIPQSVIEADIADRKARIEAIGKKFGNKSTTEAITASDQTSLDAQIAAVSNGSEVSQNTAQSDISALGARMNPSAGNVSSLDTQIVNVQNAAVATPTIPIPSAPTAQTFSVSDIPPAPSITEALNSPSTIKVKVEQPNAIVGQDISDRALSHIITGGMSG